MAALPKHFSFRTQFTKEQMEGKTNPTRDMSNRKPRTTGIIRAGGTGSDKSADKHRAAMSEWNVPNRKASARLDARRRSFDSMENATGYTRPGSMKVHL